MKRGLRIAAFVLVLAFIAVTVFNASWRADAPRGVLTLVAHRGTAQLSPGAAGSDCKATKIEQPVHAYVENTERSARKAYELGARMIEIDIAPTADGEVALFGDATLDCRTNGTGPIRNRTMAELKQLDVGHSYTANGRDFPMRGMIGQIPRLDQVIGGTAGSALLYDMGDTGAAGARALTAGLKAAGRDPVARRDGFTGDAASVAAIRAIHPDAWAFTTDEARRCAADYKRTGWTGQLHQSCAGGTMIVPIDGQWLFWGWPDLLSQRMQEAGGRIIVAGPGGQGGDEITGLTLPEQLGEVPASFTGYLWVDDIWNIGPALRPRLDTRGSQQKIDAAEGLERRRAAMGD